ncbi:MAG: shikimate kinase [Hyphomicrobiaceae bacterium]
MAEQSLLHAAEQRDTHGSERPADSEGECYLSQLGSCVRDVRRRLRMSRRILSERSGVSPRFIAQLEAGTGNISILRLKRIADQLDIPLEALVALRSDASAALAFRALRSATSHSIHSAVHRAGFDRTQNRLALIGLRGAGKSTLGARVADALDIAFVELNDEIAIRHGLAVSEIFALYGEERYRQLERECLDAIIEEDQPVVLAVGGGVVQVDSTYARLLEHFTTIWISAQPDEHMARVLAQGDRRPVSGRPDAMDHLRALLERRRELYGRAHHHFDTSGMSEEQAVKDLKSIIAPLLSGRSFSP